MQRSAETFRTIKWTQAMEEMQWIRLIGGLELDLSIAVVAYDVDLRNRTAFAYPAEMSLGRSHNGTIVNGF